VRRQFQLLVDVLRGRVQQHWTDSDLALLLEIAENENVTPLVVKFLCEKKPDWAPQQKRRLDELQRHGLIFALVWSATLKITLDAFNRAGLSVISLKGPFLAERLYGDFSLRKCYDLDLLVRECDRRRAEQVLSGLGFSPDGRGDDYHRPFNRKSIRVELHHNIENPRRFPFDVEGAWSRAVPSSFQGTPVLLLAPGDELLYLCVHAVHHRYDRICLILDLSLAFRRFPLPLGGIPPPSASLLNNILVLGWMMATKLDDDIPSPSIQRINSSNYCRMEAISHRLWRERMLGNQPPTGWLPMHRFFIELEPTGIRRLYRRICHLRILSTRLIDLDFDFASRFNLHRPWQVRMLRPIRLLVNSAHTRQKS
jgi:hypothetical protein